nr:PREDICTED: uncharacterized protein LOC106485870 isoform X4 [Apteryx mantelli mantelli]
MPQNHLCNAHVTVAQNILTVSEAVSNRPLPDPAVQARMAGVWHGYSQTLMALPAAPWVGMVLLQTKRAELCRRRLLAMVKMQNWRQRQQDFQQSEVFAKWIIVHDQRNWSLHPVMLLKTHWHALDKEKASVIQPEMTKGTEDTSWTTDCEGQAVQ